VYPLTPHGRGYAQQHSGQDERRKTGMNTNNGLPSGWTVMQQPKWKPYALQRLIDTNPYPAALAKLQKQKKDCG